MNLVTFMSINAEKLKFIKSVSLRLFCIKAHMSSILASCVLFSFPKLWGAYLCFSHGRDCLCWKWLPFSCSANGGCSWQLGGPPLLPHSYLTKIGTVTLSVLATSLVYSRLSLATRQLLLKALLSSFYSLVTGHFDSLSFVMITCKNTISQLASLDIQHVLGLLMYLKGI